MGTIPLGVGCLGGLGGQRSSHSLLSSLRETLQQNTAISLLGLPVYSGPRPGHFCKYIANVISPLSTSPRSSYYRYSNTMCYGGKCPNMRLGETLYILCYKSKNPKPKRELKDYRIGKHTLLTDSENTSTLISERGMGGCVSSRIPSDLCVFCPLFQRCRTP